MVSLTTGIYIYVYVCARWDVGGCRWCMAEMHTMVNVYFHVCMNFENNYPSRTPGGRTFPSITFFLPFLRQTDITGASRT